MNRVLMMFAGRTTVMLALMVGLTAVAPAQAAEPRWPEGPYNYLVFDQDIRGVLEQFGRNMNVPVRISEDIGQHRLRGKVGGANAKAFLQWLCDAYRLTWYFDGVTLHIMPQSDLQNVYLDLGPVPLDAVKQRLASAGLAEERFPLAVTGDPTMASLAGPPAYTTLVRQILTAMKNEIAAANARGTPTAVFRGPPDAAGGEAARPATPNPSATSTATPRDKTEERLSTSIEKNDRQDQTEDEQEKKPGKVLVFRGGTTW
jgi:type III secretion protein C